MPAELVTAGEFARRVGVSRQRIAKLVSQGRLPSVPAPKGRGRRLPYTKARAIWDADRRTETEASAPPSPASPPAAPSSTNDDGEAGPPGDPPAPFRAEHLGPARAKTEWYKAEIQRLKYEEALGQLVPVEDLTKDAQNAAALIRTALLALPDKLAPQCEARSTAEIKALLTDGINEVLQALHESRYTT